MHPAAWAQVHGKLTQEQIRHRPIPYHCRIETIARQFALHFPHLPDLDAGTHMPENLPGAVDPPRNIESSSDFLSRTRRPSEIAGRRV
jgi:hypothetical protein